MRHMDKEIHPWSKDKLEILDKYLRAYSKIMNRQKKKWLRRYTYVDAFAFTGKHMDTESQAYVDGSPFVALKCVPPFDEYVFIELSSGRLETLRQRVQSEFPGCHVDFKRGDANSVLCGEIARDITFESGQRGFVFLDPYGLEVHFSTMEILSRTRALDLFVNFSIMGITRSLERAQLPDAKTTELLVRVMGDAQLVDNLYVRQADLFGEERAYRAPLHAQQVAYAYIERVRKLFRAISIPVLMRNSNGAPLYALFLASHNEKAVEITNDILKRYERLRAQEHGQP